MEGRSPVATVLPARAGAGRAGRPASTSSPAKPAAPASATAPSTGRRRVASAACSRGTASSTNGRAAQTIVRAPSSATFVQNSVVWGAISSTARRATETAKTLRAVRPAGIVFGSVIMKKRKIRTSGENMSTRQNSKPVIGPRCQRAVISCPLAAITPIPTANVSQNVTAIASRWRRERIETAPTRMIASASAIQGDIGPHQSASGSARPGPSTTKQSARAKFDGLRKWRPRNLIRCFERIPTAAVAA